MPERLSAQLNAYQATLTWAASARVEAIAREVSTSTNTEAKELLDRLGHRALIIANHQTSGRGRGDHTWVDSEGHALLSSWIFRVTQSPQPIMSALIGLALFEAARATWPEVAWALKAPNDLHIIDQKLGAKKVAGVLIELTNSALAQVSVIVGVGLNVSAAPFGTEPYPATCLSWELAALDSSLTQADWSKFLTTWLANCETQITDGLETEIRPVARESLRAALRKHPEYRDLSFVDADGSLVFNDGHKVQWKSL